MVHIRERLEAASFNEITTVLDNVEANIGIFGGRYYTYTHTYEGKTVTGQLAFKEIIAIADKHIEAPIDGRCQYPNGLYTKIMKLHDQGEDKLEKASTIQRIFTAIRRFFGNLNFDKVQALIHFSFCEGYERRCQEISLQAQQTVEQGSPVKSPQRKNRA